MSRNVRVLHCTPEDVFEVLSDGWLYPVWVVGASRMREVDETWPMTGAELHHSFGVWPALINDKTVVEQFVPGKMMVMRARGWPIGEARVTIDVKPRGDECVVRIQEEAIAGPGRFVPAPLMDVALHWRNDETLHRLAYLAEGRAAGRTATTAEQEMAASGEKKQVDAAPAADGPASERERSATDEREDGAMTRDDEGSEPVAPTGESEWVDAATSIDAVEAGPADEPGESGALPPKTPTDDSAPTASDRSVPPDMDEQVAPGDGAGASAGTPEDSWNPMSGAGESLPVAPEVPEATAAEETGPDGGDAGEGAASDSVADAANPRKAPGPKGKRPSPGQDGASQT